MLEITNLSQSEKIPAKGIFSSIKDAILGEAYELSLVFTDRATATKLHKEWKKKPGPANILSFPLDRNSGEIFLYPDAPDHSILYLFIHGCCHLQGHTHGSKMDKEEKKWEEEFEVKD